MPEYFLSKNSFKDGRSALIGITTSEYDDIVARINSEKHIVAELRNYANILQSWKESDDPFVETWVPEIVGLIEEIVATVTGRKETTALGVDISMAYVAARGWFR